MYRTTDDVHQVDPDVRHAVRFGVLVAVVGLGFLMVATAWVGTCDGSTIDTVACGVPQRALLALGAPVILCGGGVWAFVRTYRTRRAPRQYWAWQGAGWFLLIATAVVLTTGMSPIAGFT